MIKRSIRNNPEQEQKEKAAYMLLYFFIASFLCKVAFGAISGSKALMVSGVFALFGFFVSVITLLRIHVSYNKTSLGKNKISYEKLEFFIVAGISLIIAVSTGIILFSVLHVIFFHTLYPPGFSAAWISALIAAASIWLISAMKDGSEESSDEAADSHSIMHMVNKDFILSITVIVTVVVTRFGFFVFDYIVAILEAVLIIAYSVYFLYNSFKGLMDVSCDKKTLEQIKKSVKKADPGIRIKNIRIKTDENKLDMVIIVGMSKSTSGSEVKKVIEKIRGSLRANLKIEHEVHVGVVAG
ncbi:MAG: cation transporter [Candidatus Omnitrophica bacterium]|nr:cation transporter [Candidatus Omnitrophota bacterium]